MSGAVLQCCSAPNSAMHLTPWAGVINDFGRCGRRVILSTLA